LHCRKTLNGLQKQKDCERKESFLRILYMHFGEKAWIFMGVFMDMTSVYLWVNYIRVFLLRKSVFSMQFSFKRILWGVGGETKFCLFLDIAKLKEKEIKDAHTLSYTQQSFLTKLYEHLWWRKLAKVLIISPIIHSGGILHDPVCVLPIKTNPPTHKIYICVFWNNLHHLFSTLHNFTTKTFNVTTIFPAQFRWKNNNNKMLAALSY